MGLDSYEGPDAETLLRAGEARDARRLERRRELIVHVVAAGGFLCAAALLAALAPWHRSFSLSSLALIVIAYVIVERVRFPVAGGWASPTMLVFVPMLFVLPTPVVPLVVAGSMLARSLPDFLRGSANAGWVPRVIGDAWFSMGPALVIVLAGAQIFSWSDWPVFLAALLAQFLFDGAATVARYSIAEDIRPRVQLPLLVWIYLVDAALAPLGLLIAASAVDRPALVLLALPVVGVFALFARERQQRLDAILELSTAYRGTTLLLGDIIEGDDAYTGMHSRQVVDLALGVADALGLGAAQKRNVEFGALLHDVGKIRIPKEILNKNGPLDPAEWEYVRRHTVEGEQMLRQVGGKLADIALIVRSSHERWDGGGYPDRLAGEQIPIESRIIAACDAYNAMTTDRPYRPAMHLGEALDELRGGAGSQFDPQVVEALNRRIGAELNAEAADAHADSAGGKGGENEPREPSRPGYTALSARL